MERLWETVVERTREALACGALRPIETRTEAVAEGGVRFLVRVARNLARKDAERRRRAAAGVEEDPFLSVEPKLFVGEVGESHRCVLNKFNVIPHHLLIATRRFEDQEMLLTPADFAALWSCMTQFDSLAFYNGGETAGASQRHKHLQLVPLPLGDEGFALPVEPLLGAAPTAGMVPGLPFRHAFARLAEAPADPVQAARVLQDRYRWLLRTAGLEAHGARQSGPYNLLLTREWMLLVPRSREHFAGISVNALGYAGSLFVRDAEQLGAVRAHGPLTVLRQVSLPATASQR